MRRMGYGVVGAAMGTVVVSGLALAGIEGSKHDFSDKDWTDGDACAACHTPQRSEKPKAAPLWNQNVDLSKTFGSPGIAGNSPGLGSTMCLRCHDGTIASAAISGATPTRFRSKENPGLFGVSHGRSDHPVGVRYPFSRKDFQPASKVTRSGDVTLPGGKVECISCHDPHNRSGEKFMLVKSNARSALCLTCHKK